ncbi:DEAD/DEAH box helicase family protein [Eubacterium ramulus]|uniref:ATP-binding protein n=2 Tax=Eubacterium ramulus TaxID=39490 RepID=A0A844DXW5_EUBRA|nr:DEAD/DEAH box helicase family protein [Eubacterium ramulus]MSD16297.1 ATP-binding protein [Eubacterium ramulus]
MQNPFTLTFGKRPMELVERPVQTNEIIEAFTADPINQQMFIITGVRGSGKTVMMTEISHRLRKKEDWVVIELNPATDLLQGMLSKLNSNQVCAGMIKSAKIDLSFFGFGVSIEGAAPITDTETASIAILEKMKKSEKRLLITIDEVTNSEYMHVFASAFQIFVRQDLPVFLLATGLYENIDELQNEKSLTFLYRAPKIQLKPLNKQAIVNKYKSIFEIEVDQATQMADLTKGYPFAFQVLGYLTWNHHGDYNAVRGEYEQYLSEFVYDKIWSELSQKDRMVARGIADVEGGKIKDIREHLHMETNEFNPYRKRLIKKGILSGETRGYVYFTLPLFEEYVMENY